MSTHTPQHPTQERRGAAETQAQAHTATPHTPARSGGVQAERAHEHTHTPTPPPGVAGHSRNPSQSTHTHAAHPSQEWRGTSGARTRTALLAFHSWTHRDTITLQPLDQNPHRWTPEDDATAAITVQQSPENPEEYHITWNDPAPHPPASPTLPDVFANSSAELQEAKAPQQPTEEMPHAPSPPTTQENSRTEPLSRPITTMEFPPQHRSTPDRNGFRDLPQEWAVHNGTLRWDEITPGLQAIRLHSIT